MFVADLLTFFGRLHPLVVHLPIGALLLATLLHLAGYRFGDDRFRSAVRISLLIGSISATIAGVFGYLLSLTASYDTDVLDRHMYSGIALALVSGILYFGVVPSRIFTVLLLSMAGLLAYAGHQGGTLTYGEDYFSRQQKIDSVYVQAEDYDTLDMTPIETLRKEGVVVRVMLKRPLKLDVTITPESHLDIDDLLVVAPDIILFNASGNDLKDDDLKFLREFVNLEKLRLERNPVGDGVVDHLLGLKHLVAVNLYNTNVTAAGVKKLKTNPSIQRVYVWGTKAE